MNMAENRREKNSGFYRFSRGQLVILAVGFTLTSVVVFFLGILIGQRIEERKLVQKEEPLVKIPVPSLSQGSGQREGASAKEEITFYDTLAKAPAGASVEQPKETKPIKKAETVMEVKQKVEAVKERQLPPDGTAVKVQDPAAGQAVRQGSWAIQVNAFPVERDAQSLSQKLKKKGYDAYVVSANIQGRTWYRVRVGNFATRQEARALQEVLKTKEKLAKAMTVSR